MNYIDPVRNFILLTVKGGYNSTATQITLKSGDGAKIANAFAEGQFNLTWWDSSEYSTPSLDPKKERVRVTNVVGDIITVVRGQDGTTASTKNNAGKTYWMAMTLSRKEMEEIDTKLKQLNDDLDTATSDLYTLQQQVDSLDGDVTTIQGQISTMQGQITTIQGNITTLQSAVTTLDNDLNTAEGNISTLQSAVATLTTNVGNLTTALGNLTTTVGNISTALGTAQTDITNLQAALGALTTTVGNINTALGNVQTDITTLQGAVSTLQGEMTTAQADILALQNSISPKITTQIVPYGSTTVAVANKHYLYAGGSGSGILTLPTPAVDDIIMVSDLDRQSGIYPVDVDAGPGVTISHNIESQHYNMANGGEGFTLIGVSTTRWKLL